jgi:hypothetical protein
MLLRRYQACMMVFLVRYGIATAVMVPLYLAGKVVALGIASTLLGAPAMGVCVYLCWRMLRAEADSAAPNSTAPAWSRG